MKQYEKVAYLKNQIMHMQHKFDKFESRVGKLKGQLPILLQNQDKEKKDFSRIIQEQEDAKALIFEYLKNLKAELRNLGSKPKPKPKPKAKVNEKIRCDICKEEFTKQGYPSHRKKCERIKSLELELAKELNEEEAEIKEEVE